MLHPTWHTFILFLGTTAGFYWLIGISHTALGRNVNFPLLRTVTMDGKLQADNMEMLAFL